MKFAFYIAILVSLVACQKSETAGTSSASVSSQGDTIVVVTDTQTVDTTKVATVADTASKDTVSK